jgi:hypothetical protein
MAIIQKLLIAIFGIIAMAINNFWHGDYSSHGD